MKAILVLEDGFCLSGESFTGKIEFTQGELACNTNMACYQEMLTEPAYTGQLVCMTWPLAGNYGINNEDVESAKVCADAFIVKECCKEPSNYRSIKSLPDYLMENGKAGVENLDTRALMVHLRENGSMRGAISTEILDPKALLAKLNAEAKDPISSATIASTAEAYVWENGKALPVSLADFAWKTDMPHVIVYDFGVKYSNLRELAKNNMEILVVPANTPVDEVTRLQAQGIFLSEGPGLAEKMTAEIALVKELAETGLPLAAVGLGFQLLGLAHGAKAEVLKSGKHGVNIPVKNFANGRVHISAQNLKNTINIDGVEALVATHIGVNDQILQGYKHVEKNIIAIQHDMVGAFACSGNGLFVEEFRSLMA